VWHGFGALKSQYRPITPHEVAQALGHRQHPLAHRQARKNVWSDPPSFAGEGHEVVAPAVSAARTRKAVGEDAALQIFAKRLAHIGLGGAQGALPVELACLDAVLLFNE
jgi:hypothetical protein